MRLEFVDVLQSPGELARQLERLKPDVITGYAGAVAQVAQTLIEQGGTMIRPRLVATSAEVLTYR